VLAHSEQKPPIWSQTISASGWTSITRVLEFLIPILESTHRGNAYSYSYSLTNPRPRFLARVDYHFGNSEIVDFYGAAGLGYSGSRYKLVTDDPVFTLANYALREIRLPVAFRLAFGTKIYFIKNFGATAEIGLGGPLLTVGLSGKF
jgi:hypothetical protein